MHARTTYSTSQFSARALSLESRSLIVAVALWGSMSVAATSQFGQMMGFVLALAAVLALMPLSPQMEALGVSPEFQVGWMLSIGVAVFVTYCMYCCAQRLSRKEMQRATSALTIIAHTIGMYAVIALSLSNVESTFGV